MQTRAFAHVLIPALRHHRHIGGGELIAAGVSPPTCRYISGATWFYGDSSAANATFVVNREQAAGGEGGKVVFSQRSTAGSAILQVYEGANRYFGGHVVFESGSNGGQARRELLGPSTYVDLSNH